MVRSDLLGIEHYKKISTKAYNSLHLIRQTPSSSASVSLKKMLYLSLVRSHLTYCCQLWRLHFLKDIANLERIQRRATKHILNKYTTNYKDRLITLNLLPLMFWFDLQDLMFLLNCLIDPEDNINIYRYHIYSNGSRISNSSCTQANSIKWVWSRLQVERAHLFGDRRRLGLVLLQRRSFFDDRISITRSAVFKKQPSELQFLWITPSSIGPKLIKATLE